MMIAMKKELRVSCKPICSMGLRGDGSSEASHARSQVALVLLGILLRGTCGAGGGKSAAAAETPPGQNLGYIAILGSAFGYACLGAATTIEIAGWRNTKGMQNAFQAALILSSTCV